MDYDGRFIMQKTVDWSLLRSTFGRFLPKVRKNDGMTILVSAWALLKACDESILIHGAGNNTRRSLRGQAILPLSSISAVLGFILAQIIN